MDGPTAAEQVRNGLTQRVESKIVTNGSITFPAVPALSEQFTDRLFRVFAEVGRRFTVDEAAELRAIFRRLLDEAFADSQRSTVTVSYSSTIAGPLSYQISNHRMTIEEAYDQWVATREPPLFGVEPDARVSALAGELGQDARVLDIGGGTGRNALALARRGYAVDVVELTEKFADMIRRAAAQESLGIRVIQRNLFEADDELRRDYALILLSEVVPEFRTSGELRGLFELAARSLAPGGRLVFNIFLARDSYTPDDAARQFAQQAYSSFFTPGELSSAAADLPLALASDECVLDYEKANLPPGAWPPTGWYAEWVAGSDVFALPPANSPIDMRWLVYRKVD